MELCIIHGDNKMGKTIYHNRKTVTSVKISGVEYPLIRLPRETFEKYLGHPVEVEICEPEK